jgi:hypothetical protein
MKPFVERMGLALAVLEDAREHLPAEAAELSRAVAKMIEEGKRACEVLSPPEADPVKAA